MQFTTNNLKSYLAVEKTIVSLLKDRDDITETEIAFSVLAICRAAWPQLNIELVMPDDFRTQVNPVIRLIQHPLVKPAIVWTRLCKVIDQMLYATTHIHTNEVSLAVNKRDDLPKGIQVTGVTK